MVDEMTARQNGGVQTRQPRAGTWTADKRAAFLAALAGSANVRGSARAVGMSEPGAYALRRRDPAFAAAWEDALCEGYARLESLFLCRALATLAPAGRGDGDGVGDEGGDEHDEAPAIAISERGMLTLLQQHRATVREARMRQAVAVADVIDREDDDGLRARLEATLTQMHVRLTVLDERR